MPALLPGALRGPGMPVRPGGSQGDPAWSSLGPAGSCCSLLFRLQRTHRSSGWALRAEAFLQPLRGTATAVCGTALQPPVPSLVSARCPALRRSLPTRPKAPARGVALQGRLVN